MNGTHHKCFLKIPAAFLVLMLSAIFLSAQPPKTYTIKHGRMFIQLPREISMASLDSFVSQYDLADLGLRTFIKFANADTLSKLGWKIEANNEIGIIISKAMEPFDGLKNLDEKNIFKEKFEPVFPSVSSRILFGANRFRNKSPFYQKDSIVRFFLRRQTGARQVMLAGSFNNWAPDKWAMQKTDSGWIYDVKLSAGKWWYKFVVDGHWQVDKDNGLAENDGQGNVNSVYFRPNKLFTLSDYANAKKVFLAGSFNGWKPGELLMKKTAAGWELPLYIAQGTHTYKFVVDGAWVADEANTEKVPDGHGSYNSVLRYGKAHLFQLKGFENAKEVALAGSFNTWRDFEWPMKKTATGWELPYTLGPGNYEYKFRVDGKWISDPANATTSPATGNSYLVISPNYIYRLKGFETAKGVYLAGEFNNWDPKAFAMKREGDEWVFPVHLSPGKHLYKFVVDDKWIIDPANKLWEQNEYGTGNSVLWID